jgi:uracil-DNA glycosylase
MIRKVIFVGSNPSNASPDLSAFNENTRSGKILKEWINKADIGEVVSINVSDEKTIDNKALTKSEIESLSYDLENKVRHHMIQGAKVVALGNTAAQALGYTNLDFLKLPHPSGLNRQLNDEKFVEQKIQELKDFVHGKQ